MKSGDVRKLRLFGVRAIDFWIWSRSLRQLIYCGNRKYSILSNPYLVVISEGRIIYWTKFGLNFPVHIKAFGGREASAKTIAGSTFIADQHSLISSFHTIMNWFSRFTTAPLHKSYPTTIYRAFYPSTCRIRWIGWYGTTHAGNETGAWGQCPHSGGSTPAPRPKASA